MQKPLLEFKKFGHQIHLLVEKEAKRRGFQFLAGPQGEVLTFLAKREHEGQVTLIRDIEQELGISKSVTRNLVKRMEKNNLVYLEESPTDKRAKYVFLKEGIKNQLEDMHQFFEEVESAKTRQLGTPRGHVRFEEVRFGYSPDKTIIHNFTAEAKPGQKVAIVGPTGAGKTTMVNLLMRFYDIQAGKIAIDGVDTKAMSREEVHDAFSMVLQDTWLFEGTIRENLVFNQTDISDEAVEAATRAVGVHHFIRTLPNGYDTVLNDSVTLSVGQKQLLTIARALLKDAPLLILDEATSSVDTRTEELIQKAMDKLMEGRTSFVIAHRLSTIRNADLILVMKDGNIIEQGNHQELMSQNGFYADLYNSQFTEEVA